jgi:translation initiation factor IF-3
MTRVNDEIRASTVRLIGSEGEQVGIVSIAEARANASAAGLDLVEISPNAEPPVCKVMDYGKYLFQLSKKQTSGKKKQRRMRVKRMTLRPGIGVSDYQVKLRNLIRFVEDGDKVEISLRFRGRELAHKEIGMEILQRLKNDLANYAEVEREPLLSDRQLLMVIVPKKK